MLPEFISSKHVVARKRHRCSECHGFIEPGDVYERVAGSWDGRFDTFKTCIHCEEARDFYEHEAESRDWRDPDDGSFAFTCVFEDLHEFAEQCDAGTGMKFRAYRHVVGMRRRYKQAKEAV